MKKFVSILCSFLLVFTLMIQPATETFATIKTDYLYWAQQDSSKPWANMSIAGNNDKDVTFSKYGCWILAYTKLIIQCGARKQESFTPVEMTNWLKSKKMLDNNGCLVGDHPTDVANAYGMKYVSRINCSSFADANTKIKSKVAAGYYVIVRFNGHSAIVDNERTSSNGYATLSNSWTGSTYNVHLNDMQSRYSIQYIDVFSGDATAPSVSNVKISNITAYGYTITCTVSDNRGVSSVKFPTWYSSNGSSGCTWYAGKKTGANTWSYTYSGAKVTGNYTTYVYAYDSSGNRSRGVNAGKTYTKCRVSKINIGETGYVGGKKISISSATSDANIYYKIGKSGSYKKYTRPFNTTSTKDIYAYGTKSGYINSYTNCKTVSITKLSSPTYKVSNCLGGKTIEIKSNVSGASIYYKVGKNGTYKKYTGKIATKYNTTIYAYASAKGYINSYNSAKQISDIKTTETPKRLYASTQSNSSIKLTWNRIDGATGYTIYRSTSKSGVLTKIGTVTEGDWHTFTDTTLGKNETYYYQVQAFCYGNRTSSRSAIVSATTFRV